MRKHFPLMMIALLLLATVVLPSLVMRVLGAPSMAAGTFIISALYVFLLMMFGPHPWPSKGLGMGVSFIIAVIVIIFAQSAFSFLMNDEFDLGRFWQSCLLLIIYILGAWSFSNLTQGLSESHVDAATKVVFNVMLLVGLAGIFKYSPFFDEINPKAVFFYSEPSHFALSFLPFLLYMVVASESRMKFLLLFASLLMAIFLENLTLVVGITLISFFAVPLRRLILIFPFAAAMLLGAVDMGYYSARLDFSRENDNLSTLVYLQGWERSFLSFIDSFGFGVGFQQFGIVGSLGEISEKIEKLAGLQLNLLDGGSTAPKFIGEFGFLGLLLILLYLVYFARSVKWLYELSMSGTALSDSKQVFFHSCFVMYCIDLFVRGTGYFSPSGFLFISSMWWMVFAKFRPCRN